jgi:hypothetical protein
MSFTLEQLQSELLADPSGLGYSALRTAHNYVGLAAAINLPRAGITFQRPNVSPLEILEAINVDDFVATANQQILMGSWFESLTQFPSIRVLKDNGDDTRVMTNIMKVLKNGTASETRVRALSVRLGSRAEQIWGQGVTVTVADITGSLGG